MTEAIKIGTNHVKMDQLRANTDLLLKGLQYSGQISHLIKSITNLHVLLNIKMQKNCLQLIFKLIEFLKLIKITFEKNIGMIIEFIQCILQYLQHQLLVIVANTKVCYLNL